MNYYYDILLNFQDIYYMFYEWEDTDDLLLIKKIPMYHISSETLLDLLLYKVRINNSLLEEIHNKTKLKGDIISYCALFSDGKNTLAILFDNKGISINKSSLLLDDEVNIHEFIYSIPLNNIKYELINKEDVKRNTRQEERIKNIINVEIKNIYDNKEYSKLKYYYLEWFNKLDNNIDNMYKEMINKIKEPLGNEEYKIYELIKMAYNV